VSRTVIGAVSRAWIVAVLLAWAPCLAHGDSAIAISGRHGERIGVALEAAVGDALPPGSRVDGRVDRVGRRWRARIRARSADGMELASATLSSPSVAALARRVGDWAEEELATQLAPEP
jgi:hypothetical protein